MEYQFESIGPVLRWVVLAALLVFLIAAVAVIAGIAAFPGWVARKRNHPQAAAINICGWFGLPTGIMWVVAVVWAYMRWPNKYESPTLLSVSEMNRLSDQLKQLESAVSALESKQS